MDGYLWKKWPRLSIKYKFNVEIPVHACNINPPYVDTKNAFFFPTASLPEVFDTIIQADSHNLLISSYFDTCLAPNPNLKCDFPHFTWRGEVAVLFIGKRKPFVQRAPSDLVVHSAIAQCVSTSASWPHSTHLSSPDRYIGVCMARVELGASFPTYMKWFVLHVYYFNRWFILHSQLRWEHTFSMLLVYKTMCGDLAKSYCKYGKFMRIILIHILLNTRFCMMYQHKLHRLIAMSVAMHWASDWVSDYRLGQSRRIVTCYMLCVTRHITYDHMARASNTLTWTPPTLRLVFSSSSHVNTASGHDSNNIVVFQRHNGLSAVAEPRRCCWDRNVWLPHHCPWMAIPSGTHQHLPYLSSHILFQTLTFKLDNSIGQWQFKDLATRYTRWFLDQCSWIE